MSTVVKINSTLACVWHVPKYVGGEKEVSISLSICCLECRVSIVYLTWEDTFELFSDRQIKLFFHHAGSEL